MEQVEKAVIMARGLGTRMRRTDESAVLNESQSTAADSGVKAMIPIGGGRPFLDYVLSALADAGFKRACMVIGPEHENVREYFSVQSPPKRIRIEFAVQEKPLGTADAVAASRQFAGNERFLLINSDNYYPTRVFEALAGLEGAGVALFDRERMLADSNIPEDRIRKFSVAEVHDCRLKSIHEKPSDEILRAMGTPLWINMNCWLFTPTIFEACGLIDLSERGELELTAAVQYAIDILGERFEAIKSQDAVLDLSNRSDIAPVVDKLLTLNPKP